MTASIATADVCMTYQSPGTSGEVSYSVICVPPRPSATLLAELLYGIWTATMSDRINSMVQWTGCVVRSSPLVGRASGTATGSDVGSMASPNVCFLVTKIGQLPPPGRMYLPGVSEAYIDEKGYIDPAVVSSIDADLLNWRSALAGEGILPAIKRPLTGYDQISILKCRRYSGTQRNRLLRARELLI